MTQRVFEADEISAWLVGQVAEHLEVDPSTIDPQGQFDSYGLASSDAVFLSGDLSEYLGMELSATLAWDYTSIADLAEFLAAVTRGEAEIPADQLDWDLDGDLYDIS
jgi:acyl carrier protein